MWFDGVHCCAFVCMLVKEDSSVRQGAHCPVLGLSNPAACQCTLRPLHDRRILIPNPLSFFSEDTVSVAAHTHLTWTCTVSHYPFGHSKSQLRSTNSSILIYSHSGRLWKRTLGLKRDESELRES